MGPDISKFGLITFATALLLAGLGLASEAIAMNEHWVCSMPHKLEPSRTVIFDFQVAEDKLIQRAPVEIGFSIVRNDDMAITAIRVVPILSDKVADVVGIDKQRGIFKFTQVFFGEENDIPSAGDCKKLEVDNPLAPQR